MGRPSDRLPGTRRQTMSDAQLTLTVNGRPYPVTTTPDRSLLAVLRSDLGLTGTKYGCGEGECGSCTVLVAGSPVHACQMRLSEIAGREVSTVEGLSTGPELSPLQRAFVEAGAFQCGYCTPGMLMRATALLASDPTADRDTIEAALEGNICRCGGYRRILDAVERVARSAAREAVK